MKKKKPASSGRRVGYSFRGNRHGILYLLALETTVYLIESIQQAKLTALKGLFPGLILAWCVDFQIWPEEGAANSVIDTERLMNEL